MKRFIVIVSVLFGLMQTAYADNFQPAPMQTSHADDFQPYVGVALGQGLLGVSVNGGKGTASTLIGWGSLGFLYKGIVGAELRLGGSNSSTFSVGGLNFNARADWFVSYLARAQLSLSDRFDFYALLGGTTAKKTVNITTPGYYFLSTGTPTGSWTDRSVSTGIGFEYHSNGQLHIGAEIMAYGYGLSSLTASLRYSF